MRRPERQSQVYADMSPARLALGINAKFGRCGAAKKATGFKRSQNPKHFAATSWLQSTYSGTRHNPIEGINAAATPPPKQLAVTSKCTI